MHRVSASNIDVFTHKSILVGILFKEKIAFHYRVKQMIF